MDKIFLRNLEFYCCHGVNPEEKINKQRFLVSVEIYYDATVAKANDDINSAVNYADVYKIISNEMTTNTFCLLEKLADHLLMRLKEKYIEISKIDIEISKFPNSWYSKNYGSVGFMCSKSF